MAKLSAQAQMQQAPYRAHRVAEIEAQRSKLIADYFEYSGLSHPVELLGDLLHLYLSQEHISIEDAKNTTFACTQLSMLLVSMYENQLLLDKMKH